MSSPQYSADSHSAVQDGSAWRRFWGRGGLLRAILLSVIFFAILSLADAVAERVKAAVELDAMQQMVVPILAILLPGLLVLAFVWTLGRRHQVFARERERAPRWMWIGIFLALIPIVGHVANAQWSEFSLRKIGMFLLLGACIGFTEELFCRGLLVDMLRRGNMGERGVALWTSLLFCLLHLNVAIANGPLSGALLLSYTFGFGFLMYLVLRATGRLLWAMVLHGLTDPTTMLAGDALAPGDPLVNTMIGYYGFAPFVFAVIVLLIPRIWRKRPQPVTVA